MPTVEVRDLTVRFGDVAAVDGVSFDAAAGAVTALLGPNGAGKTTTVETAEGYRRPTSGTVRVLGLDPWRDRASLRPRVGVMLQRGGVYPSMHALDAVRLFAAYYDDPLPVGEVLARVGIRGAVAKTPWRRLSGGEQQRVSLALALVGRPDVAFLDEPAAGIDPSGRLAIREVVRGLRDDGVCVVLTTHDVEEAERVADRVVIVDHGTVVADATPAELTTLASGGEELRFRATGGLPTSEVAAAVGAAVTEERSGEYVVAAPATPERIAALTQWLAERGVALGDLRAGRQSLEDVFLRLTGGDG